MEFLVPHCLHLLSYLYDLEVTFQCLRHTLQRQTICFGLLLPPPCAYRSDGSLSRPKESVARGSGLCDTFVAMTHTSKTLREKTLTLIYRFAERIIWGFRSIGDPFLRHGTRIENISLSTHRIGLNTPHS